MSEEQFYFISLRMPRCFINYAQALTENSLLSLVCSRSQKYSSSTRLGSSDLHKIIDWSFTSPVLCDCCGRTSFCTSNPRRTVWHLSTKFWVRFRFPVSVQFHFVVNRSSSEQIILQWIFCFIENTLRNTW